jgi:protein-S-isoprenylcysteine O-methyltransferase Ste14
LTGEQDGRAKAAAVALPIITALIVALFALSYGISVALGLPSSLNLPAPVRIIGAIISVLGLSMITWTFRQRSPGSVIVSTYITFNKALRRILPAEKAGRTEQLVVIGPQRYTRNPLYFGVMVMVLGWALFGAYSFVFVATLVLLIWFTLVLIPFEERELRALFGYEWVRYSQETPMLIPLTKRKTRAAVRAKLRDTL